MATPTVANLPRWPSIRPRSTRDHAIRSRLTSSSYNDGVGETRSYNDDNTLASISYSGAAIGDLS